ncbi:MAG: suppressor of fused domain protein [Flavobacteriaceae bacterium]|nr:suppressor of fused domain protein [Flavobacteriaceae bacterium]
MNIFKKIFGKKDVKQEFSQEEYDNDYELKMAGLEFVLGKSDNLVGHAIIPFEIGGAVDMYYFPNGIKGTGFATMELLKPDGTGSIPNKLGTYELVAFTKLNYVQDSEETNPFNLIERHICGILTNIGFYSFEAKLEPLETCEIPGKEGQPNICLILDEYKPDGKEFKIGNRKHGLLLVMEVHRDEMEFAMSNGTKKLIEKLKEAGYYPYSDLDRKSVVE